MKFNYLSISLKESTLFEMFKIFLMIQVVLGHIAALSLPNLNQIEISHFYNIFLFIFKASVGFGRESAYLFIFLSGFFTAKIFIDNNSSFKLNLIKRFKRILPILIIAIIFTAIFDLFGIYILNGTIYYENQLNYIVKEHLSFYLFVSNILSLQPTFSLTFGSNGPIWTLGYLVQFFVFALIIKSLSINFKINFIYLFTFINIISYFILGLEFILLNFVWLSGLILRTYNFKKININILLSLIFFLILLFIEKLSDKYIAIVLTPVCGFLILYYIKKFPSLIHGYKVESFPKFEDMTYSLYAIHMPILFLNYSLLKIIKLDSNIFVFLFFISATISSIVFSILIQKLTSIKRK